MGFSLGSDSAFPISVPSMLPKEHKYLQKRCFHLCYTLQIGASLALVRALITSESPQDPEALLPNCSMHMWFLKSKPTIQLWGEQQEWAALQENVSWEPRGQ